MKLVSKGHTSYIFKKGNFVTKVFKKKTTRKNIEKEYRILKNLENLWFLPKVYKKGKNYIIMDYIEGELLKDVLNKYDKESIKKIFELLIIRTAILDLYGITHSQLQYGENIIIDKDLKPWIIDFEKAKENSKSVKNLGQIIGYYVFKYLELNDEQKQELINLLKKWKLKVKEIRNIK